MNDIAICGKNKRFCRMLELELQALGYTVTSNPPNGRFQLWIVDLDTVTPNSTERLYLGITRDTMKLNDEPRALCQVILQRPFALSELRQEVSRLLSPEQTFSRTPHIPPMLSYTPRGFELDGELLALTDTEEQVLRLLYERHGETVSRQDLCELLGSENNDKLADVYICLLRKKLEVNGMPRLLFTVRGVGYRLEIGKQL